MKPLPGRATIQTMFFTIPTLMTWTRIVAIPLIVGVYYPVSYTHLTLPTTPYV